MLDVLYNKKALTIPYMNHQVIILFVHISHIVYLPQLLITENFHKLI